MSEIRGQPPSRRSGAMTRREGGKSAYLCPSCERFIGPADTCPYCDADSAKRPVLRVLRYSALLLGVTGLAFLYLMVTHKELPVIRVGDITPMMNFAYVRVKGTVERDAYIAGKKGKAEYLSFSLDDGSGQLRVAAYGDVARCLVEQGMTPKRGALVDAAGSLSISADERVKLIMRDIKQINIVNAVAKQSGVK